MTILSELYMGNGNDVILNTIELSCEVWPSPIVLVGDFVDHEITTEDGRTLTATGSGIGVSLPKRDTSGQQNLTFAIDNVRSTAADLMRVAMDEQKRIDITYRAYISSDLSEPSEKPYKFIVKNFQASQNHVEVTASLFDLINMKWPRFVYNSENSPGLKYMQ